MNQPMYPRLAERIVGFALINLRLHCEDDPTLNDPSDMLIKEYLAGSSDCVIYPHQMGALVEDFKAKFQEKTQK